MSVAAVFDTKPYDREYLSAAGGDRVAWRLHDFRLGPGTAAAAEGAQAACIFVNDCADRPSLAALAAAGVRLVALRCAGHNHVDLAAAHELGLAVTCVPAYSPHAVAEHAVALLLALNRRIPRAALRVRELNFSLGGLVGFDLHARTVSIAGTGKIGRIAAQIFRGFGCRVLASDTAPDPVGAAAHGIRYVDFPALLAACEILSLHLPLLPDTRHLLDAAALARLPRGAYVVNTSRGKLIDSAALIAALKSGHLGGVALDVYEEEEGIFFEDLSTQGLSDDTLARVLTFPNVLITAHQAFLTREALAEIARVTVENIARLETGEPFLEGTQL